MNLKEFLIECSKLDGWYLTKRGMIRRNRKCPIVAVAIEKTGIKSFSNNHISEAADEIGFDYPRHDIVYSADHKEDWFEPRTYLREPLLKACNL